MLVGLSHMEHMWAILCDPHNAKCLVWMSMVSIGPLMSVEKGCLCESCTIQKKTWGSPACVVFACSCSFSMLKLRVAKESRERWAHMSWARGAAAADLMQIWYDVPFWCLPWRAITHKVWHVMWKRMDHPDTTLLLPCFLQVGTGSAHEVLCKRTFGWLYGHRGASLIQKWAKKGCWWSWNLGNDHYNSLQGGLDGWYDDGKFFFREFWWPWIDPIAPWIARSLWTWLSWLWWLSGWVSRPELKKMLDMLTCYDMFIYNDFFFKGNYEIRGGWLNQTNIAGFWVQ
jgi:hypothetical protein